MSPQDMKETLVARTISVIANEGLDKTTTKAIVTGTGINEAYIYRCFAGKEDLMAKAFDALDNELVNQTLCHLSIMFQTELSYEERCRIYFYHMWNFMLQNREHCLSYVQYYYSPYFEKLSADDHFRRYAPVVEAFRTAFIDEADVWLILNHILNVMLDFAIKVHNGKMPSSETFSEHVFRVTYASVKQYFKTHRESEA